MGDHVNRLKAFLRGLHVSWPTVVMIAVVVALVDAFVLVALERTVGAIERRQPPFQLWLRTAAILTPFLLAAAVGALALARRSFRPEHKAGTRTASSLMAVIAAMFLVGLLAVVANSGYDYYLQVNHLQDSAHLKHPTYLVKDGTPILIGGTPGCDVFCVGKQATLNMHLRGLGLAAVVLLVANTVFVLWTLALCGGRLWVPKKAERAPIADAGAVPAMI
jgi:hypothetical protein